MPATDKLRVRDQWLGSLALIVCAALWSLNGPLIKLLAQAGVAGVTTACYRSLLGGLILAPFAMAGFDATTAASSMTRSAPRAGCGTRDSGLGARVAPESRTPDPAPRTPHPGPRS